MLEVEEIVGHKYGTWSTAYEHRAGRAPSYRYWYHLKFKGYPVNSEDWFEVKGMKNSRLMYEEYRNRWTGEEFPKQAGDQDGAPPGKGERGPTYTKK